MLIERRDGKSLKYLQKKITCPRYTFNLKKNGKTRAKEEINARMLQAIYYRLQLSKFAALYLFFDFENDIGQFHPRALAGCYRFQLTRCWNSSSSRGEIAAYVRHQAQTGWTRWVWSFIGNKSTPDLAWVDDFSPLHWGGGWRSEHTDRNCSQLRKYQTRG